MINKTINKVLLAGDKFMSDIDLLPCEQSKNLQKRRYAYKVLKKLYT